MRPLSTVQLLKPAFRPTYSASRPIQNAFRRGYCSSCKVKESRVPQQSKAKAVTDPPIPPADHRQLGIDQALFTTSIYSPGSPLFLPNGARIFNKLVAFLRAQYTSFGFEEVITPTIYKKSLWEKSGHWDNYAEDMFSVMGRGASGEKEGRQIGEDEEYGLKPMNCPGHCLLFASKQRSFRELPIRYADFSPLHRNEISGALSGLTRVRRFHQDDGHIFCRPSQVGEEISKTLEFVRLTYATFNLGPYRLALSTRPKEHYIGTEEDWINAEAALQKALNASGQPWTLNEGDGAFYGPKIDIILKDSDGKEHQTATIQLDFQLPKRFELEYQAPAPELEQRGETTTDTEVLATHGLVRPVMIHRAVLGSVERFMALLIEHYNGRWPFWLNPRQIIILTVNDSKTLVDYALKTKDQIQGGGSYSFSTLHLGSDLNGLSGSNGVVRARELDKTTFSVDIDDNPRSLGKKIVEAKKNRYSVIVVVGERNAKDHSVSVEFNGISDPHGLIRHELGLESRAKSRTISGDGLQQKIDSQSESLKKDIELSRLRNLLLNIERAYL